AHLPVEPDAVAIAVVDVDHRAQPAAELGWVAALVDADILDGVGVEGREEAEEVRCVVDGRLVEEDERLVRATAADVEAAGEVAGALDAGQELERAEEIVLDGAGDLLDELDRDVLHPDGLLLLDGRLGLDDDLAGRQRHGLERKV